MDAFTPKRVFYESDALNYSLGKELLHKFRNLGIPTYETTTHNRVTGIPGKNAIEGYAEAKRTLVLAVRRGKEFQSCKPSAHFQLPLVTSCPGMCEYCYLATTLGKKPYIRVYVNINEILDITTKLIVERLPQITVFEGAATSDPVPVEDYTGSLRKTIEFFGKQEYGRFRFVTKFTNIDSLLSADHQGHTRFRFSLNCNKVIQKFEHATPSAEERIEAATKVARAKYPLGFIIAPIILFDGWQSHYRDLLYRLASSLKNEPLMQDNIRFEFITHRFTSKAKHNIINIFPKTELPMEEETRQYKYGQFGYGKYIYKNEDMDLSKYFFNGIINELFPGSKTEYHI